MATKKTTTKTTKKSLHICSECLGDFDAKDIFYAVVPQREGDKYYIPHATNYCAKCLKELGITEYKPYLNPRKPRTKKEK